MQNLNIKTQKYKNNVYCTLSTLTSDINSVTKITV